MTIHSFEPAEKEQLLQIVAEEFPVFVLGPGCYRVGFDNPYDRGWSAVEHRVANLLGRLQATERTFLSEFFLSKLSDERRTQPARSAVGHRLEELAAEAARRWEDEQERADATNIADQGAAGTQFEPWRTFLAVKLLEAFRHASCCLGLVIGEGRSPVLHWQDATVSTEAIAEWSTPAPHTGVGGHEEDARYHFRESRRAIQSAALVARAMDRLGRSECLSGEQVAALQGLPLTGLRLEESVPEQLVAALASPLEVLLPARMATMLEVLDDRCFRPGSEPLCGANIEWLGDLLWHVLASDAEVQPSQADVAFYVTLSEQESSPGPRDLRRPAYGDRVARGLDLTRLTTRSQPDDQLATSDRGSLLRTIAVCLLTQYEMVEVARSIRATAMAEERSGVELYSPDERAFVNSVIHRHVVALVGDYGDKLERALFHRLAEKAKFHVGVPVWLSTGNSRQLDWLLMDVHRGPRNEPVVEWRWLREADTAGGPIVIKLNGCDRPPIGVPFVRGRVADFPFVGGEIEEHRDKAIDLAVLYDEHDQLTAMQSFDELLLSGEGGLVSGLAKFEDGLRWRGRSWVIMGQRFADWIPRLRLFTHKWIGSRDAKETPSTSYWAIDRSFDWPERSLLESLGITMVKGELRSVVNVLTAEAFTARRSGSPFGRRFAELFESLSRR